MATELRQTTRSLLMTVEGQTKFPVQVQADLSMPTSASMSIARGGQSFHYIRYKPVAGEDPDYLICFQCGLILRKFAVPQDKRMDMTPSKQGLETIMRLLEDGIGKRFKLADDQLAGLQHQLLDGLMIHLLSVPIGLRVGAWLMADHLELAELQKKHVAREIRMNRETMSPDIKQTFPAKIYDSTHAISAAFALFWSDRLGDPQIAAPWIGEHRSIGKDLLKSLNDMPDDPTMDKELIDRWAERLKLTGWYDWIPYRNPQ